MRPMKVPESALFTCQSCGESFEGFLDGEQEWCGKCDPDFPPQSPEPELNKSPFEERLVQQECRNCGLVFEKLPHSQKLLCNACREKSYNNPRRSTNKDGSILPYKDANGYIHVYVNGRSIAEHRAVMEEIIGRPLRRGEEVHHKNGVRDDNTPFNLELWIKPHPAGQRASDFICPHCDKPYWPLPYNPGTLGGGVAVS